MLGRLALAFSLVIASCVPPELNGTGGGGASATSSSASASSTTSASSGTGGFTTASSSSGPDTSSSASTGTGGAGGAGGAPQPLPAKSCIGMPGADKACGPQKNVDCCDTIQVPAGTFNRSNDPTYPATVSTFWLDRYEMTVGRYRAIFQALPTQGQPPPLDYGARPGHQGTGWQVAWPLPADNQARISALASCALVNITPNPGPNERLPMNCLSWYEAFLACAADGGYMPTEAEWNYAAAGGADQRNYPWGAAMPTPQLATFAVASMTDVGVHSPAGDAKWGHADMAGNAREWAFDYNGNYPVPCMDCIQANANARRIMRGGQYSSMTPLELTTAIRDNQPPDLSGSSRGIRCVRFPP